MSMETKKAREALKLELVRELNFVLATIKSMRDVTKHYWKEVEKARALEDSLEGIKYLEKIEFLEENN